MLGRSRRDAVLAHPAWVARPAHTEQSACVTGLPTTSNRSVEREPTLTERQAYEAAYRFVAQYHDRERIVPFMLMLVAMEPKADHYATNDPASWTDWQRCLQETLDGAPLPTTGEA